MFINGYHYNPPRTLSKYFAGIYGYHYNKKEWKAMKKARKLALRSRKFNRGI